MELSQDNPYQQLIGHIAKDYQQGQHQAAQAINTQLIETYWQIGQRIVEFEQNGQQRAEYGKALITQLAKDLTLLLGKGFSRSNVVYMRLFYLRYPISQKPSHLLSWSNYVELLKLDDELERGFYEQQAIADYLDAETAKIDDLIAHTNDEIALLKELRAATIADAVLGRVDVRTKN